jgi:class 3 adenylate cyclase/tetratricopeptide (TPR) repeat protein
MGDTARIPDQDPEYGFLEEGATGMADVGMRDLTLERSEADVHGLDSYIPFDRRAALTHAERLPDRTSGAALFADISGFSALTEDLSDRLGPQRGAEELSRLVNLVLSDVIAEVHRFGGSVIGFPGDGVTCWFDGDDGRRAAAAALAAQNRRLREEEDSALGVKLGATSGLARRFLVGHSRIQRMDVVAGAIVDRMAVAEELGRPGEVLIGGEIVGWVRDRIEIIEWRQDKPAEDAGANRPTPEGEWFAVVSGDPEDLASPMEPDHEPDVPAEVARDWVIPAVYERLLRGRGEFLSEIRSVVTLFNQFGGIRYDLDNEAEVKLDRYIRWVQTVLARYEAFLLQLVVGDKGSYFYAGFGAPLAHEDDAVRAVKAATELVQIPPELRFIDKPRIGISQGKMLAGAYGGPIRKTYGVLGRAANVAARLMQAAQPGQVLVGGAVAEIASTRYVFAPTSSDDVVEVVEERAAPQVLAPKGRRSIETVGRAVERARLAESLQRLLDGQPDIVVIEGVAGIGKSRLMADLKREAESLGIPVHVGAGSAIEHNTPFYAWRSIFRDILGLQDRADQAAVRAAVEDHLAGEPQLLELASLLNPVLPVDLPDTDTTAHMPPSVRSSNALEVLVACLRRRSAPLSVAVLVLDDAQWLDSASWGLLERVRAAIPHVFIAVATRPPEPGKPREGGDGAGPSELRRLVARTPDKHILLEPLSEEEIGELAARYLGVPEVPTQLRQVLSERAEGNPFFAEALIQTLEDRGLIEVTGGRCIVKGTIDQLRAEFPEGVERLLTSRLDHLTLPQQSVLLVASILGGTFTTSMLRDIAPPEMNLEELEDQLEALVEMEMLVTDEEPPERSFEFRHGLIRQAAAELLPPSWRRDIHGRTAQWLEEHHREALTPWYSVLAHHWDEAGEVPKALDYLDLAAAHAFASSAYEESVRLYQRALELAGGQDTTEPFQLARWHLRLGEVYVHRQEEDVTSGRLHLEEGLRTIGKAPPANPVWRILALLGQLFLHLSHRLGLGRGSPEPLRRELLLEASRAYERLVEVYYISRETSLSLYAALRALNLAEAAGPSSEQARGLATVGAIFGFIPLRRVAERYLARALAMADPEADPAAAAWTSLVAAFYQAGLGNWAGTDEMEGAEPLARRVVELSTRIGDSRRIEDGLSNLMIQAYLQGEFAEGLALSDRLLEMAQARGATRPRTYGLQGRSYCLLDSGRITEARLSTVELDDLLAEDPRFADQALIDDTAGLLALAEARAGRVRRATLLAEPLLARMAGQSPSNFSSLAAYAAPAEVLLIDWRTRGSSRTLRRNTRRALRLLGRYVRVFPIGGPRLLLWSGVHAGLRGRAGPAARLLRESARAAGRLGLRFDEARALLELADRLGRDGGEGRQALRRAETILTELEAKTSSRQEAA